MSGEKTFESDTPDPDGSNRGDDSDSSLDDSGVDDSWSGTSPPGRRRRRYQVLLIEDSAGDSRIIRELLGECAGAIRFDLEWVNRLSAGIARLAAGGIDVVLLDLTLPESHGLETFYRAYAASRDVPIVVLTGNTDDELALAAIEAGAQDFLHKGDVSSREISSSLRFSIERSRRKRAERVLRANEEELRTARHIQQKLFPASSPHIDGYDIAGASHPAELTGGDYFDFVPMRNHSWGIVIADVSGHGFGPAMLMTDTRAYLRAFSQTYTDVGEILGLVDRSLFSDTAGNHFVTLILMRLIPRQRTLVYSSAGHPTFYLLDRGGAVKRRLESTSVPLGVFEGCSFPKSESIALSPGDLILLVTDGVIDSGPDPRTIFGTDRILDVVCANRSRPADQIVAELHRAARTFAKQTPQRDDLTAVVVKVLDDSKHHA